MNVKINELYFNPKFPASLLSLQKFYREAKKVIKDLTYRDIVAWSKQSEAYTMHKSARKNFRRERIYTNSIDYLWEIDLVDVSRLKEFNDGYTFLLVCIDTFSKYVWIRPLKKKTGKATVEAFTDIVVAIGAVSVVSHICRSARISVEFKSIKSVSDLLITSIMILSLLLSGVISDG